MDIDNGTPLRFLSMDEVSRLLRYARGTVHHDIIYVLARTGVRAAELAGLRWEDVDLERRVIRVGARTDGARRPPGRQGRQGRQEQRERRERRDLEEREEWEQRQEGGSREARRGYLEAREIPIDAELAKVISRQPGGPGFHDPGYDVPRRLRRELVKRNSKRNSKRDSKRNSKPDNKRDNKRHNDKSAYVFQGKTGPKRHGIARHIARLARLAGLARTGVGPRTLRRTFAAHLVMNGADTGVLRELLGVRRAESLKGYRPLLRDRRIPRGRPIRPGHPEGQLDGRGSAAALPQRSHGAPGARRRRRRWSRARGQDARPPPAHAAGNRQARPNMVRREGP